MGERSDKERNCDERVKEKKGEGMKMMWEEEKRWMKMKIGKKRMNEERKRERKMEK